jgi:hypothetical protein
VSITKNNTESGLHVRPSFLGCKQPAALTADKKLSGAQAEDLSFSFFFFWYGQLIASLSRKTFM